MKRTFSGKDRILFCRHCALWILVDSSEIVWWHWTHVCIATVLAIRRIEWRERALIYSIDCSVKQFINSWFKECSIHIAKELAALINIDFTSLPAVIKVMLWFLETCGKGHVPIKYWLLKGISGDIITFLILN